MSALAKLLSMQGYEVSGSDAVKSEHTDGLPFYGVKVFIGSDGSRKELLAADAVVYTDAIPENHLELTMVRSLGKKIYSRAQLLSVVCEAFPTVVAVAGSHGKTTCTAMCAHILRQARAPFAAHIGGTDGEFGNFTYFGEEYFVTEACEYKKNFLQMTPSVAILLNIDNDHMECYEDERELLACFYRYCAKAKAAFVCADDHRSASLGEFATFGIESACADYRATRIKSIDERYSFTVEEYGKPLCRVKLNAVGRCHIYNALGAFAAMRSLGFDEREIAKGLESFTAVKRRFERIGSYLGAHIICDYAHHPRELISTLKTALGMKKGELFVVFQPHTYSRTRLLFSDFVEALRPVKNLMIYKTYPAREKYDESGSAGRLARALGCLYCESVGALKIWLDKTVKEGDTVLFLGAGDIYHAAKYILGTE